MKTCSKCGVVKALDDFYANRSAKTGRNGECKPCTNERSRARYAVEKKRIIAQGGRRQALRRREGRAALLACLVWWFGTAEGEAWAARDAADRKAKAAAVSKAYYERNAEALIRRAEERRRESPALRRFYARTYQARKRKAVPAWANLDLVAAFYTLAEVFTKSTGTPHHVDHIEPLQGKHVCGLHNEFNLQVLPAKVNAAKGNRPSEVRGFR